jgi:SAM-dependent methyltransferase
MHETSKTKKIWNNLEKAILQGNGLDIGCGTDPITPEVRRFDLEDGDANEITNHVHEQFDFVYSSHCLEHMHNPRHALAGWWKLVKPGGHLLFIVPDEDLYEQGVFPSRFNPDHKATFTIAKARSWSPVSINVLDLARSLPDAELIKLELHDIGYDRSLLRHGKVPAPGRDVKFILRVYHAFRRRGWITRLTALETLESNYMVVDQTRGPDALAQIQCIIRKTC